MRFITLACVLSLATFASAARPGFESLDLVVDRDLLEEIAARLALSEAQQAEVHRMHESYFAQIVEMDRVMAERIEGFRVRLDATPDEEQDPIWQEWVEATEMTWRRADAALTTFYAEMAAILGEDQRALLLDVERLVRRGNMLDRRAGANWADYGAPVDLSASWAAACAPEGELHLPDDAPEEASEALRSCAALIAGYESDIDLLLVKQLTLRRTAYARWVMRMREESPEDRNQQQAQKWKQRFDVLWAPTIAIGRIVEPALGAEARRAWELRIARELAPTMMGEFYLDTAIETFLVEYPVTAEEAAALQRILQEYLPRCHVLRMALFTAGARAMGQLFTTEGARPIHLEMARALLDLEAFHDQTCRRVSAALTPELAAEWLLDEKHARVFTPKFESWFAGMEIAFEVLGIERDMTPTITHEELMELNARRRPD